MHTFEVSTGNSVEESTEVALTLMHNVNNASELRKFVMGQGEKAELFKDVVLIKAKMVVDVLQIKVALQKALWLKSQGRLTTRSVATDTLFLMSPSKSIRDALTMFGVDKSDRDLIIVAFSNNEQRASLRLQELLQCIKGTEKELTELKDNADLSAIRKLHKVGDEVSDEQLISLVVSRSATKELL